MARILIVEDEKNAREALGEVFSVQHEVRLAEDVAQALEQLRSEAMDLVLTDVVLPGERDGLDLLREVKSLQADTPVIVMTAYGSVEKAVRAMRDGAHDFLEKPLDLGRLRNLVASTLRARAEAPASAAYRKDLSAAGVPPGFVGDAPAIREVFRVVQKAAPTNATVLILGESGTGKELVAEAIHRASPRARGPFVKVNCAALPEGLLESELFGHVKGAFTGAVTARAGRFEAANHGTLFLDEVGEVPPHTQVKLLRVLQNREIERVGESRTRPVDVRLVAATNADLEARVRKGDFREDFYFRLKVVTMRMPPLRERTGDIPALTEHFRKLYGKRHGRDVASVSAEAMELLLAYEWPGNVRELENLVEAAVVLSEGDEITPEVLPVEVGGRQHVEDLPESDGIRLPPGTSLPEAERRLILDTLRRTDGNKTAAARILGIGLRTLYRKLEQYETEE
ncbi:MAG: sigma-54-dependent transcriptional regulator [Planctomycetota bacterium]|jgi:DNA-binding NtrC family response regulator